MYKFKFFIDCKFVPSPVEVYASWSWSRNRLFTLFNIEGNELKFNDCFPIGVKNIKLELLDIVSEERVKKMMDDGYHPIPSAIIPNKVENFNNYYLSSMGMGYLNYSSDSSFDIEMIWRQARI